MSDHPDTLAQTIREQIDHAARGCRSGLSHNPAVYEQAHEAALDELLRLLKQRTKECNEATALLAEVAEVVGVTYTPGRPWEHYGRILVARVKRVRELEAALRDARSL